MFDPKTPFNPPFLPSGFDFNQIDILKAALRANHAIAKLNGLVLLLPNPELLVRPLVVRESVESSAIENINTTTEEALKAETLDAMHLKGPEKEIAAYKEALLFGHGFVSGKGFIHTNLLVEIGDIVEPGKGGIRKLPGTVIANGRGEAVYTPPVWEENIRNHLRNLENFINDFADDVDPLVKVGAIHYQFESIHPFYDGNWRTGRILMILYLVLASKLDYPILFLSEYINANKAEYYSILNRTSMTGDYRDITLFMLTAIELQARSTAERIVAIDALVKNISSKVPDRRMLELVFSHPFVTIKLACESLGISRQTASKYVFALVDEGVFEIASYWRTSLFFNREFVRLLGW